jgi:5-hydroxyisourate hydrolase-like protein (transthyretin family)
VKVSTLQSKITFALIALGLMLAHNGGVAQQTLSQANGPYRIAGTVVSNAGGAPLPQSRVSIMNVKNRKNIQSVLTAADGRFEFHVTAGKYALRGAKRGFIDADYNQHEQFSTAIVTGAGLNTEELILKLDPSAALVGKVLDESGDPVRQARVTLWREDHSAGVSRIVRFRTETTDDRGAYEFTPLDSGTYFLSVTASPWYAVHPVSMVQEGVPPAAVDRSLDVVYPTTFYAGATEVEDASPIPVRGGDRLELDLRLIPIPALHVLFHTDQKPENGYRMPMLQKRIFDDAEFQNGMDSQMVSPGVFEITTAPGKYNLQLSAPTMFSQMTEVVINQDHQELSASSGEAFSSVSASIHSLGEEALSPQLFLLFRDQQHRTIAAGQVSAEGKIEVGELPAGTYELQVSSPDGIYSVARISSEGHETSGHTLKVTPGSTLSLDLYLVGGSANVEGFAMQAGKLVAGAMIVLVPKRPEANRELFRRDQSDLDGSFTLQNVVPGTYTVTAIADGWDLDWSKPGVISNYAKHGQTIVVPAHAEHSVKVPQAVEVQPK